MNLKVKLSKTAQGFTKGFSTTMKVGSASATESTSSALLGRTGIIIPTYNASRYWERLSQALRLQGIASDQVLIVDSSSTDNTRELAKKSGFLVKVIHQEDFRHGATRQLAAESLPWAESLVYLTQDAIPAGPDALEELVSSLNDMGVGAAYGRQIARAEAEAIETHARLFNYSDRSEVRSFASRSHLGFRAAFFSNSFAAYRRSALDDINGFPLNVIVSEDVTVAARMLVAGWKIAYNADAQVIHSHSLSLREEFSRYFDIGVHHARQRWLIEQFGSAGGEGLSFVKSEFRYLWKTDPWLIPVATIRNVSKWSSYHLGLIEPKLPLWLKQAISAQPGFWADERTSAARGGDLRADKESLMKANR